jgi:uncharacterized damage-inducible protein DinB
LAIEAVIATESELASVIESLTDAQYCQKPVGVVPSSVGGHVRHCLDHVDALVASADSQQLNYDDRRRGTDIESSRTAALDAIGRHVEQLPNLATLESDLPLRLRCLVLSEAAPIEVETSLARELAFVLSHTIHHASLISVMVKMLGVPVPERLGYAPSTIAFRERSRCAP